MEASTAAAASATPIASVSATQKSAEELQREIDELFRRQREISARLKDPRGLRKSTSFGNNSQTAISGGTRQSGLQRGQVRRIQRDEIALEDQPPAKKRISSAVVKVNDDPPEKADIDKSENLLEKALPENEHIGQETEMEEGEINGGRRPAFLARRDNIRGNKEANMDLVEPAPRVLTKEENPSLAKRNRRMFGALLGTLQRFAAEDVQRSSSEAFTRRSEMLKRAEQKAQEESQRLRQQEREQMAEKRRRDLSLRARLAAKTEEKQLELLFIQWMEHNNKLSKILRTKMEPRIYYVPAIPTEHFDKVLESQQKEFEEWRIRRREELSKYQKEMTDRHLSNVEAEIERWTNRRNAGNMSSVKENEQEIDIKKDPRPREEVTQEEEDAEEDFMADDDMDTNVIGEEESKEVAVH